MALAAPWLGWPPVCARCRPAPHASTGGGGAARRAAAASAIGVNGYLWRATLDTLAFMPLASADPTAAW